MLTVVMLKDKHGGALGLLLNGTTPNLPDDLALDLVNEGAARWPVARPPMWPDANQSSSAGIVQRHGPGSIALPISRNVITATQGVIAMPSSVTQPLGVTLKKGSKIKFDFQGARTNNNQTDTLYVRYGKTGGSADPVIMSRAFNVAGTQNWFIVGIIEVVDTNEIAYRYSYGAENIGSGSSASRLLDAVNIDNTGPMYLSLTYTAPAASADYFDYSAGTVEWLP